MTIDTLRGIEGQLTTQQRARLGFVLLSLDPTRDSPETLRTLAKERGITSASLASRAHVGSGMRMVSRPREYPVSNAPGRQHRARSSRRAGTGTRPQGR